MCSATGSAAFTVLSITTEPSGSLTPGTPVTINYTIGFPGSGGETFASDNQLQMISNLDNPHWTTILFLDGVDNLRPEMSGQMLTYRGFELSYPSSVNEQLRMTLKGNYPTNPPYGQNLLKVQELDSGGNVLSGTVYVQRMPGTLTPTPTPTATATPSFGSISVSSTPPGASILLDNEYKGMTPLTMNAVSNGDHVVIVRLAGYQDWTQTIPVLADATSLSATLVPTATPAPTTTTTTIIPTTVTIATTALTATATTVPATTATTIRTTIPTTEITPVPITSIYTPATKPVTIKKTFTPIPETTTKSPGSIEVSLFALCIAGLVLIIKR